MFVYCLPLSVCFYVLMNQSIRNIQDSGLKLLANLKLKEIVSKKDSMVSVSNFGLTKFFENLCTLQVVDLSGASCSKEGDQGINKVSAAFPSLQKVSFFKVLIKK